jgi:hypothetical protein
VIAADPDAFFLGSAMAGGEAQFGTQALAEYREAWRAPEAISAFCEDYRAGATVDFSFDNADRAAGRRIACPLLALWGSRGALPAWHDVLAVWREWAERVAGRPVDATHYVAEDAPEETADELERSSRADIPHAVPDLTQAVDTVITACLGVRAGENVVVVADPGTREIGDALHAASRSAGAEAVLCLMEARAADGNEPPAAVAGA